MARCPGTRRRSRTLDKSEVLGKPYGRDGDGSGCHRQLPINSSSVSFLSIIASHFGLAKIEDATDRKRFLDFQSA